MKALSLLTAGLLAISASALAESKTSVVLVHGTFADGSSWNKVITLLQKACIMSTVSNLIYRGLLIGMELRR